MAMHYKYRMMVIMSALCYVNGVIASHASKMHEVEVKVESKYLSNYRNARVSKSITLCDDDYSSMKGKNRDRWVCQYFSIPQDALENINQYDDIVEIILRDDRIVHEEYFEPLDKLIRNTFTWWINLFSSGFYCFKTSWIREEDCKDAQQQIKSEFAHACIRAEMKRYPGIFYRTRSIKNIIESNAIVQADPKLSQAVKDVWNILVDQVCIFNHGQVCKVLSCATECLDPNNVQLCTYVCGRQVGKKMLQSWMKQLSPEELGKVEECITSIEESEECSQLLYNVLEDVKKDLAKKDTAEHKFLFESKISMLNKKLIFPALVCAVGGLAYYIYRYMQ